MSDENDTLGQVCPPGWTYENQFQICVPPAGGGTVPNCPSGYAWNGKVCAPLAPSPTPDTTPGVCPENWVWDKENVECRCGPPNCPAGYTWVPAQKRCVATAQAPASVPGCWPGSVWDPVQQKCVAVTPTGFQAPTTTVVVAPACPPGSVWVAAANRCVPIESVPIGARTSSSGSRVGEPPPEEQVMQVQAINPDGSVETVDVQPPPDDAGTVGQNGNGNGNGNGDPAPSPSPDGTVRFRFGFPFVPFWNYPIVARYPYPPPYAPQPRPQFPMRLTVFVRSVTNVYQSYGWIPIAVVEVDNIATALQIARCVGGAIGPVGSVAPTQFPG